MKIHQKLLFLILWFEFGKAIKNCFNMVFLISSADWGSLGAECVDSIDDGLALESQLAHVDEGIQLAERVVIASEVKALGVVGLNCWVVAVEVGQLELGVDDCIGRFDVLGDVQDNLLGQIGHDATLGEKAVQLGDGLQLGLAGGGSLDAFLEDGAGNLKENKSKFFSQFKAGE